MQEPLTLGTVLILALGFLALTLAAFLILSRHQLKALAKQAQEFDQREKRLNVELEAYKTKFSEWIIKFFPKPAVRLCFLCLHRYYAKHQKNIEKT